KQKEKKLQALMSLKTFLSSVDLHTQCNFQTVLGISIAVVVSLKDNCVAIFTMSESGLNRIQQCPRNGFHLHHEDCSRDPIYGISSICQVWEYQSVLNEFGIVSKVTDLRLSQSR
ncbi:MAG: hypothetical protein EZS28_017504, partial [Streblomastix strix]